MDPTGATGGSTALAQLVAMQRLVDTPRNILGVATDTARPPRPQPGVRRISAAGTDLYL